MPDFVELLQDEQIYLEKSITNFTYKMDGLPGRFETGPNLSPEGIYYWLVYDFFPSFLRYCETMQC